MENWRREFSVSSKKDARAAFHWRDFLNEVYYPLEVTHIRRSAFTGALREIKLGDIQITKFIAGEQCVERTKFHIRFDRGEDFIFIIPQHGMLSYRQFGRDGRCLPNSSTLLHCAEPYWTGVSGEYANITVRIPAYRIRERVRDCENLCAQTLGRNQFLNIALAGLVNGLFENSARLTDPETPQAVICSDAIVDMVVLALNVERGHSEAGSSHRAMIYQRILDYLKSNLLHPELSPQTAAEANGISVSYMNKVFRASGQSVAKVIQDERLILAYDTLLRRSARHLSIGQIAFDAGFNNQAHFTSCFRAKYGMTPREVRKSGAH